MIGLLVGLAYYIILALWLSSYTSLFKISRPAWLEMDLCGYEGAKNMVMFQNINITNFSLLFTVLTLKIMAVVTMLIQVMGLIGSSINVHYKIAQTFESTSIALLLIACSLQLYKFY